MNKIILKYSKFQISTAKNQDINSFQEKPTVPI